jgi:hypothetical protein
LRVQGVQLWSPTADRYDQVMRSSWFCLVLVAVVGCGSDGVAPRSEPTDEAPIDAPNSPIDGEGKATPGKGEHEDDESDAGGDEQDDGGMPAVAAGNDAAVPQDAGQQDSGTPQDAGSSPLDSGVVTPVVPENDGTPYFERTCNRSVGCPLQPDPERATTVETDLCYSETGSPAGTCTFYCAYHYIKDGKEWRKWPAGHSELCEAMGGECYPIGKDVFCLEAGTDPECGDDPFCG